MNNTCSHGDIQRMLGAKLGNLKAMVAQIDHPLLNPPDFMSKDQGILLISTDNGIFSRESAPSACSTERILYPFSFSSPIWL